MKTILSLVAPLDRESNICSIQMEAAADAVSFFVKGADGNFNPSETECCLLGCHNGHSAAGAVREKEDLIAFLRACADTLEAWEPDPEYFDEE